MQDLQRFLYLVMVIVIIVRLFSNTNQGSSTERPGREAAGEETHLVEIHLFISVVISCFPSHLKEHPEHNQDL